MAEAEIGAQVVDAFFVIAWLFPVIVIAGYYARVVGGRWREIEGTFFSDLLAPKHFPYALKKHPAARYLAAGQKAEDAALRRAVRAEFERFHAPQRYFMPLVMLLVVSACGLWLCRSWVHEHWFGTPPEGPVLHFPNTMSESVVMALAGAYVWGIWEIIERVRERNLTPSEIRDLCFRWLVAIPVGYAFSLVAGDEFKPTFAFVASAFPLKTVQRLVREANLKKLGIASEPVAASQQRLYTSIEGVSDVMASRLEELAVYTVLDMAYSNPIRIMVKTGVPIRTVLDWMDQALLRVYATTDQRATLLKFGMRCSVDVSEFVALHVVDQDDTLKELAGKLKMSPPVATDFLHRIAEDPQVRCLYHLWYPDGAPEELGGDPELANKKMAA